MPKITSTNKDKEQSIRWKDKTFTKTINGWKTLDSDRINKLSTDYPSTTNTQLVPSHVIRRRPGSPTLWFDADCRAQSHITVNVIVSNVATDVHIVLLSLSVKEFLKSVKIWQSYCQSLEAWFFLKHGVHIEGDGTCCGDTAKWLPCRQWSFASFSVRLREEALYWDSNVAGLVRYT